MNEIFCTSIMFSAKSTRFSFMCEFSGIWVYGLEGMHVTAAKLQKCRAGLKQPLDIDMIV